MGGLAKLEGLGPNCFQRHHSGCVADLTQAKGQETVSASESSVILAGEPLFAALFSAICLGEFLGPMGYLGGALIVMGGPAMPNFQTEERGGVDAHSS